MEANLSDEPKPGLDIAPAAGPISFKSPKLQQLISAAPSPVEHRRVDQTTRFGGAIDFSPFWSFPVHN
jgi:hypothetical protein